MKSLITHVGSLPFTQINEALDYTFSFDIPVLFTLPKLNLEDEMVRFVVSGLGLGDYRDDKVFLNQNYLKTSKQLSIPYLEGFTQRLNGQKFKYQLIGPFTLWNLISNQNSFDKNDFLNFLCCKYQLLLNELSVFGEFIFVLDEPLLNKASAEDIELLNNFAAKLTYASVGIHCCSKLSRVQTQMIKADFMNLDLLLNQDHRVLTNAEVKIMGGIVSVDSEIENLNYPVITPTCGLGFHSAKDAYKLLDRLKALS